MSAPPPFDVEIAQQLVGKHVLVGVTFRNHDGEERLQHQYHGVVVSVGKRGIALDVENTFSRGTLDLPPDLRGFTAAAPGSYRLRSTGEIVEDPDFIANWIVDLPSRDRDRPDADIVRRMIRSS